MSLASKSLSAVSSNYVGTLIRVGAQFVAQILIMRELGPELVGTFGYVLLLYGVVALVVDQGFGWSLIQANHHDEREIAVVFSRIMFVSILGATTVFAISYPVERMLNNELVGTVFRYSAPSCLLMGMFVVSQAKLRAELRFKEIQFATSGAYVIAYPIVGVGMAWSGFGVWALLAAWYVQATLQVLIAYRHAPHSLRLTNPFRKTVSGPLGAQVAGINILNWGVDGSSGVFVGSMGASALGNFNAAIMLARTPALQLVQTLQTILFSTASAIGDDLAKIKRLYLTALATIGFLVMPAYGYATTHGDFLIGLLFGEKWGQAGGMFSALSLGMIALAISTLSSSILTAIGQQKAVLVSQLTCLGVMVAGVSITAQISLVYVGLAVSLAYSVRLCMQLHGIARTCDISLSEFLTVLRGPFFAATLMALPISSFLPNPAGGVGSELLELACKCGLLLILFRKFQRFFFCSALIDLLSRFALGRRLISQNVMP